MHRKATDTTEAVDAFMAALAHPCKAEVETLRGIVTSVDPRIAEGIKWNAPSWRLGEYFATTHLRARQGIAVILHLGAKTRAPEQRPRMDCSNGWGRTAHASPSPAWTNCAAADRRSRPCCGSGSACSRRCGRHA